MDDPWLTIVGMGEDGPDGLPAASLRALAEAEAIMGPSRHLALLPDVTAERVEWPVPFAEGLLRLQGMRGRRVVVLASGDPFWFGAGSVIARAFDPEEWRALPGVSCFSLAASRLGWPVEETACLALHAAPLTRLVPHLHPGARLLVTLRDGASAGDLARWLASQGFGTSRVHLLEALGGPRQRVRSVTAAEGAPPDVAHPVMAAIEVAGGAGLPLVPGRPDASFANDGQITKAPVRALTLAALSPRPGETLWDIGAGSGSVALEWLLAHASLKAVAVEARTDRAARIRENALALGQDRLTVVEGRAPEALAGLPEPQAVFAGGGLDAALLDHLTGRLGPGTRLVANAVTLETEALVTQAQARLGGSLLRIELSEAQPLGRFRGWKAAYPLVQWSVTL